MTELEELIPCKTNKNLTRCSISYTCKNMECFYKKLDIYD